MQKEGVQKEKKKKKERGVGVGDFARDGISGGGEKRAKLGPWISEAEKGVETRHRDCNKGQDWTDLGHGF